MKVWGDGWYIIIIFIEGENIVFVDFGIVNLYVVFICNGKSWMSFVKLWIFQLNW